VSTSIFDSGGQSHEMPDAPHISTGREIFVPDDDEDGPVDIRDVMKRAVLRARFPLEMQVRLAHQEYLRLKRKLDRKRLRAGEPQNGTS